MIRRAGALLAALSLATACGNGGANAGSEELNVFAASSLTDAFEAIGTAFENTHPGVSVRFTFGGSGALARQIDDGADADVFAAADEVAMDAVAEHVEEPVVFARNALAIVVEPGNPKGINALSDLAGDVVVVLCAPSVPCGRYAADALEQAGVDVEPASVEDNVRAVVAKVALGEADAGVAYVTDALAAGSRVDSVDFAVDPSLSAVYPMAVVRGTAEPEGAAAWVEFVRSRAGRGILSEHGFLAP